MSLCFFVFFFVFFSAVNDADHDHANVAACAACLFMGGGGGVLIFFFFFFFFLLLVMMIVFCFLLLVMMVIMIMFLTLLPSAVNKLCHQTQSEVSPRQLCSSINLHGYLQLMQMINNINS